MTHVKKTFKVKYAQIPISDEGRDIPLSGIYLLERGWKKDNPGTYTKGNNTIFYDGCTWTLNGKRVEFIKDIL
jgi:hypothetical protein